MKSKRKKKKSAVKLETGFIVKYEPYKGWIVDGAPGKPHYFITKMEAENYSIQKLNMCPKDGVKRTFFPQLPTSSVWTGAPWDKSFKTLH